MTPLQSSRSSIGKLVGFAFLIPCIYLPTLSVPFDFVDDGCLVYPSQCRSLGEEARAVWERTVSEFHGRGPFRPVCWAHWMGGADLFGPNALHRRLARLAWAVLSTGLLLWLLREMGFSVRATVLAAALAQWSPTRGEIWLGLGLTEAFAMPYALLALLSAVRASRSSRPLGWDVLGFVCLLAALGIKNTFAALAPPVVLLRLTCGGLSLREGCRRHWPAALALGLTLIFPITHFLLFKPGQGQYAYKVAFTWWQGPGMVRAVAVAANYEIVLLGLVLPLLWIGWVACAGRPEVGQDRESARSLVQRYRPVLLAGLLLAVLGIGIYLPVPGIAGRYTIPAVWGLDILVAFLLTALECSGRRAVQRFGYVALAGWLLFCGATNLDRQWKYRARAQLLWQALQTVERQAPSGAVVTWVGKTSPGVGVADMPVTEAEHFCWHLQGRGRRDLSLQALDSTKTAELLAGRQKPAPALVLAPVPPPQTNPHWVLARRFHVPYRAGMKSYECFLWQPRRLVGHVFHEPSPRHVENLHRGQN